jgi:hypothetical protein
MDISILLINQLVISTIILLLLNQSLKLQSEFTAGDVNQNSSERANPVSGRLYYPTRGHICALYII